MLHFTLMPLIACCMVWIFLSVIEGLKVCDWLYHRKSWSHFSIFNAATQMSVVKMSIYNHCLPKLLLTINELFFIFVICSGKMPEWLFNDVSKLYKMLNNIYAVVLKVEVSKDLNSKRNVHLSSKTGLDTVGLIYN